MIEQERRIDPTYRATLDYMIETLELCGFSREEIEKELEEAREQAQAEQENIR
jgi:Holliday junction resolvasome RuvABC DNA-binding subunit